MCLAIPGQVVEMVDEANQIAKVDVVGVRRNINVSLLANDGDHAQPGRLGPDPRRLRALQGRRGGGPRHAVRCSQRMGAEYEQELEELKASVID